MPDLDSRSVGNMRQNAQNAEQTKVIRNSNRFPLDYTHPTTHRYGDIDIFYHYYGERGDSVPLRTGHSVRTFTMKSPNEIDIYMRKHFVHVPMKAIYPRTWDTVLYPLPVDGDTAPFDARANFPIVRYVKALVDHLNTLGTFTNTSNISEFADYIRYLDYLSNVVSNGSLLAKVNMHFSDLVSVDGMGSLSFDRAVSAWYTNNVEFFIGRTYTFTTSSENGDDQLFSVYFGDPNRADSFDICVESLHQLLDYFRTYNYSLYRISNFSNLLEQISASTYTFICNDVNLDEFVNIESVIAYQLACAQFYTNDRVDDIYSASVFRDYFQSRLFLHLYPEFFEFDGVQYLYEVFSQHYFSLLVDTVHRPEVAFTLNLLFDYRKSLRFGDYFLGARTKPLAVGESSVPVGADGVRIEDITRSAALQRLRYNINVIGRKINNQLQGLIPGLAPKSPDDIPTSIASQDFNIGKDATFVNNTSESQIIDPSSQTMLLNSGASDYAFEIELTEPCILLGLVSFAVPRVYSKTIDRFAFHLDRYDMFTPPLQFVGDQEIYQKELFGLGRGGANLPYAYNQQYSEYKQRYPFASGGFVEFLPSWEMITDNQGGVQNASDRVLSPRIAHSVNSEFDRFFVSLLGFSHADYFHFIVKHYNTSTPERAMAWNPQPLL